MRYNHLWLVAITAFGTMAAPTPDASPEAQPAALPDASPDALAEALPVADPLSELEEPDLKEPDLEERAASPAKQCPVCPAVLKQELAPFAGVSLAKDYCASTTSNNPALQNFENLLVKNKELFCCCLFPGGSSTIQISRSVRAILATQPLPNNTNTTIPKPKNTNTTVPVANVSIPIFNLTNTTIPTPNNTNTTISVANVTLPHTTPNITNTTVPVANVTLPHTTPNNTNTTIPVANVTLPHANNTNATIPNNSTNPKDNCTRKKGKKHHRGGGPGLFRRMWRSWTGEPSGVTKPITLVDGMAVEKQALVTVEKQALVQPELQPEPRPQRIGGGSLRHRGVSLTLESAPGVGLSLKLEIPDINLPEAV